MAEQESVPVSTALETTQTTPELTLPDLKLMSGDCHDPEAQVTAAAWWAEFIDYMELRRVLGLETMTLSHSGQYPIVLPPNATAEQRSKVCKSLAFATADSMILHEDRIAAGEIDHEQADMLAMQVPISLPHSLTDVEMATITKVAFMLAYSYRTSDIRRQIEEATSPDSDDDTPNPDEHMPHERHPNRNHLDA